MSLWSESPEQLRLALLEAGLHRGWLLTVPGTRVVRASHPLLAPLAAAIQADARDYHGHQAVFFEIGAASGFLLSAAVHRTVRGQAAGGVRFWVYDTVEAFVRDGLRLARGMGHKNALAGLWWGGGKGVVARRPGVDHTDPAVRRAVYNDYGRFMTGIRGCYVTAEDAGTTTEDMADVFATTRHTTCIPERLGGSGNPSRLTATGVVVGMEAALHHLGMGDLEGKTVAMQGLGNVARFMIRDLCQRKVGRIVGTDVDERAIELTQAMNPEAPLEARVVPLGDASVLAEKADIVAPNAVGAVLNARTIPTVQAPIVCGAANNQLEDHGRDGPALQARGVLYCPDFLVNRMGIVNCANECYGSFDGDPAIQSHLDHGTEHGIFQRSLEVFRRAATSGLHPAEEAVRLAEELGAVPHPIWGNRGQQIIDFLVESRWAEQGVLGAK
ncbi:MAG: Glu/Leu/Phe/Val dehydrogenase dimerization domain-containing protein [Pseudomonadota bacterium]